MKRTVWIGHPGITRMVEKVADVIKKNKTGRFAKDSRQDLQRRDP